MQNELKNIETVSNYLEGKSAAEKFFQGMMDYRQVTIRTTGVGEFECYTDSGSDDYFYFKIKSI